MRFVAAINLALLMLAVAAPRLVQAGPLDSGELFQPDVYPSRSAATTALAERAAAALSGVADVETVSAHGNADAPDLAVFATSLSSALPDIRVEVREAAAAQLPERAVLAMLMLTDHKQSQATLERGNLTLTLAGGSLPGQKTFSSHFIEKPWAADWSSFVNSQPASHWIRGQSDKFAATQSEALDSARRNAAGELWPRVRDQMNRNSARRSSGIRVSEPWVRVQLEQMLRGGRAVKDTFVQNFERPYGNVWRASILVDSSSGSIDAMARHCSAQARAEFTAKTVTAGSMMGMLAVLFLLYVFVNAVTRGYFIWRLRAAAALLAIAGILIVLAVT